MSERIERGNGKPFMTIINSHSKTPATKQDDDKQNLTNTIKHNTTKNITIIKMSIRWLVR